MPSKGVLLLSFWTILFSVITTLWIFKNTIPPAWDQANYLEASEYLRQSLANHGLLDFLIKSTEVVGRRGPLISILPVPLYLFFGPSNRAALFVNLIFFWLFVFFFYRLIRRSFGEKVALSSVLITSTMPLFYGVARQFYVEFGLTTIVVVWLYFLVKSNYLTSHKNLLILGIITGLGFLMKTHFFLFVAGPATLIFWQAFKRNKIIIIKNLTFVAIPAILIAGPWYIRNIKTVLWHAKRATNPELLGSYYYGLPFSLDVISKSLWDIVNFGISGYYSLILLALLVIFIIKRARFKFNWFLISWFFVPFLVFFFGPNKDYRLMLPILPLIAVFISWLYFAVINKNRFTYLFLILIIPVLIFVNLTLFEQPPLNQRVSFGHLLVLDKKVGFYVAPPRNQHWPIVEILRYLANLDKSGKKIVILASEHESFNINNLRYYALKEESPLTIKTASYFPKDTATDEVLTFIDSGDLLIMRVDGEAGPADINRFNGLIVNNLDYSKWQKVENGFSFPDGGKLLIFRKFYNQSRNILRNGNLFC